MEQRINSICVFGASSSRVAGEYFDAAYRVGELIAQAGCRMIFGAGDAGLMGAAARGCTNAGGSVIGVIPEKLNKKGIYFEGCAQRIETRTMHERKETMEELAGGFIALAGGYGTIEEFMEALTLKQLSYFDKPIVLLNTLGYYNSLIAQLEDCIAGGFTSPGFRGLYAVCDTPEEAVEYCVGYRGMSIRDKLMDAVRDNDGRKY